MLKSFRSDDQVTAQETFNAALLLLPPTSSKRFWVSRSKTTMFMGSYPTILWQKIRQPHVWIFSLSPGFPVWHRSTHLVLVPALGRVPASGLSHPPMQAESPVLPSFHTTL